MLQRKMNVKHCCRFKRYDNDKTILRTASAVDSFYAVKSVSQHTGEDIVHFVDPIHILFNQQRIQNQMGIEALRQYIDSLRNQKNDPLAELRKQCSDDDLLQMVKSRHLQSPSEIMAWSRYVKANMDKFNADVQELVKAREAELQKQKETTDPAPTAE